MVDYWEAECKNKAFGELEDGKFSYKKWAAIYESKGWTEDLMNLCYVNPVRLKVPIKPVHYFDTKGKKRTTSASTEEAPIQWANYEYDNALSDVLRSWKQYHELWNFRLNKLEMARFDLRRVKQTPEISLEEALFVCLGLSPAVIGDIGFTKNGNYHHFDTKLKDTIGHSKFTLDDITCEFILGDVGYYDYKGNRLTLNSGIYNDNGYGMMELALRKTEEYHLIDSNRQLKSENGLILTKPYFPCSALK